MNSSPLIESIQSIKYSSVAKAILQEVYNQVCLIKEIARV